MRQTHTHTHTFTHIAGTSTRARSTLRSCPVRRTTLSPTPQHYLLAVSCSSREEVVGQSVSHSLANTHRQPSSTHKQQNESKASTHRAWCCRLSPSCSPWAACLRCACCCCCCCLRQTKQSSQRSGSAAVVGQWVPRDDTHHLGSPPLPRTDRHTVIQTYSQADRQGVRKEKESLDTVLREKQVVGGRPSGRRERGSQHTTISSEGEHHVRCLREDWTSAH